MTDVNINEYAIVRRYTYRCEAIEDIALDLGLTVDEVQVVLYRHAKAYATAVKDNPEAVLGDALVKLKVSYEKLQVYLDASIREGIEEFTRIEKDGEDRDSTIRSRKVTTKNQSDPVRIAREMRETLRDYLSLAIRDSGVRQDGDMRQPVNGIDADLLRQTVSILSRTIGNDVAMKRLN